MARIKTKIRKGDTVVVVTGRERGKSGKVLSVDTVNAKLVVEKLNMLKRHTKPNQKLRQGGILEREAPLGHLKCHVFMSNNEEANSVGNQAQGRRWPRQTE